MNKLLFRIKSSGSYVKPDCNNGGPHESCSPSICKLTTLRILYLRIQLYVTDKLISIISDATKHVIVSAIVCPKLSLDFNEIASCTHSEIILIKKFLLKIWMMQTKKMWQSMYYQLKDKKKNGNFLTVATTFFKM